MRAFEQEQVIGAEKSLVEGHLFPFRADVLCQANHLSEISI